MGIIDGKLMCCHVISEESVDKKIPTREYYNRTVYECFNNPFTDDFGIPDMNLPPINIDDIPHKHKIALYTPYLLPDAISVASEHFVSTLTAPSYFLDLLPADYPNPLHAMNKDEH